MESKLIKVKTDGDILRDAYVISGLEIDGSEYVVYYIDRDDGENDNIFASKLINNNDGTYNMLNIENANEKINVTNTVKELVMKAIEDSEHDTLEDVNVNLRSKVVKLCPVVINKEQAIDIQKTYITTVKKSVTAVAKKYYNVTAKVQTATPVVDNNVVSEVQQPEAEIVSSVTVAQTVPTVVEPVLPTLEVTEPVVAAPVVTPAPIVEPAVQATTTPIVNVQPATPVLDIPAGIISEPVVAAPVTPVVAAVEPTPVVAPAPVVTATPVVDPVVAAPIVAPAVEQPTVAAPVVTPEVVPQVVVAAPTVQTPPVVATVESTPFVAPAPVVTAAPVVEPVVAAPAVAPTIEPSKLVLDASKESNLNSALGEMSKEAIAVADINAIKEFGEEDTPVVEAAQPSIAPMTPPTVDSAPKTLTKKAGFANSKFFMFIAVGFFIASCVFMGYEAFNYYQIVK